MNGTNTHGHAFRRLSDAIDASESHPNDARTSADEEGLTSSAAPPDGRAAAGRHDHARVREEAARDCHEEDEAQRLMSEALEDELRARALLREAADKRGRAIRLRNARDEERR